MQDVCRFRLLGLTGMFAGVPVFLTFYKNICSYGGYGRMEKG